MIGDRVIADGIVYEVVFDGRQSLLDGTSRPSTLAESVAQERRAHPRGQPDAYVLAVRRARKAEPTIDWPGLKRL